MRRVLPILALSLAAVVSACAERPKSEEAPTPTEPIPPANPAVIATSAKPATSAPMMIRKLDGLRRINVVRPPASAISPPLPGPPATADAATGG